MTLPSDAPWQVQIQKGMGTGLIPLVHMEASHEGSS